mmetsp:Transcript_12262/g.25404  ORF Transcript_12262/g.25404 Transcript_12262/m.25404 type:complete len:200 (-) Transcript_12262:1666-2265(-)
MKMISCIGSCTHDGTFRTPLNIVRHYMSKSYLNTSSCSTSSTKHQNQCCSMISISLSQGKLVDWICEFIFILLTIIPFQTGVFSIYPRSHHRSNGNTNTQIISVLAHSQRSECELNCTCSWLIDPKDLIRLNIEENILGFQIFRNADRGTFAAHSTLFDTTKGSRACADHSFIHTDKPTFKLVSKMKCSTKVFSAKVTR